MSFGFSVRRAKIWNNDSKQMVETGGWVVNLPHQCDSWEIAYGPQDEAVIELRRFIGEAQQALGALKAGVEIKEEW